MKNTTLPIFAAMLQGIKSRNTRFAYSQSRMTFCAGRMKPRENLLSLSTANIRKIVWVCGIYTPTPIHGIRDFYYSHATRVNGKSIGFTPNFVC